MQKKDYYIKEADNLFGQIIRSFGKCQRCGSSDGTLQCAHFIGRSCIILRWDANNCLCLCHRCHNEWAHKFPKQFKEWFASEFPERYSYVMEKKNDIWKVTIQDMVELCSYFREKIKEGHH
jgi:5-methylcytosine-specific restriction endonuclease McrA